MKRPDLIDTALESSEQAIANYVAELEAENLKLHKQIARFRVQGLTEKHKFAALEAEMKELAKTHGLNLNITSGLLTWAG